MGPSSFVDRRQFLKLCGGSVAFAAGCRSHNPETQRRASTLIMAVSDVNAIRPDVTDLDQDIFLPLATTAENGDYVPRLAESWQHSPDYREWTYHLRQNVHWHDGTPTTADDVKFTMELLDAASANDYGFQGVEVLDAYTVRVRARPGYQDDIVYYPRHLVEHLDPKSFMNWDFWLHPVGNGPYRFVRYVPETMMEFEANPDYYAGKRRIEHLILKFVGTAGLTELLSGNVDVVIEGDPAQAPWVLRDSRFRAYYSLDPGAWALFWHERNPLFREPAVRRALTMAIDRRELLRLVSLPDDLPFTDGLCTHRQFRRGQYPPLLPYNPREATAVLSAAGWRERGPDGVLRRKGQPFRFTAICRNTNGLDRVAVYVQAMLRRVGVDMGIQLLEDSAMWARFGAGDFEACIHVQQVYPYGLARDYGRTNLIGYRNEDATQVIENLLATADPDQQDQLYARLTNIFLADMPVTRLLPGTFTYYAHRRVHGLRTPFHADPERYVEDLWLEDRSDQ